MYLTFHCPRCDQPNRSEELGASPRLTCVHCEWAKEVQRIEGEPEKADGNRSVPAECLRCGNEDLWRQKNFPQWAGLSCVALGAVTSSVAWGYHRPELALGILMGFALLDMVLYMTMPDVLVCYRCRTKHHQADVSQHGGFNHELAERYRQERIRLERSEASRNSAHPPHSAETN
ncbi:hypothetical protein SH661x_000869 [Planctomicrobium sp. SH661]|uniref:hypothetical protein n=1 Tax=Planctomicrobium sp. SH661 TaxID=3448124 RepID=UPI003F5C8E9E